MSEDGSTAGRRPVVLPKVADSTDEVAVVEWLVTVGDQVAAGDPLLTVETDKAQVEVPAPVAGRVTELSVAVDDDVVTGTTICVLEPEAAAP